MIQIIKSPIEGTVFLSENPLEIEVLSNSGSDYYFKFIINVDGVLFDTQGWSKYTLTKCKANFKGMFVNLFKSEFSEIQQTELKRLTSLFKRVDIVVEEYNRDTDTLNKTIDIPHFFVMQSQYVAAINHNKGVQKLSELPNTLRLTADAVLAIPLWVYQPTLSVRVLTDSTVLWSKNYTNLEKGVFNFTAKLGDYVIQNKRLRIEITDGTQSITQIVKIQDLYLYTISNLYFKNVFGVFEHAQLFGESKNSKTYKRKNYNLPNNTSFTANTSLNDFYKINTGFLLPTETVITSAINTSEEIYLFVNNVLVPVIVTSKKSKGIQTDKYYDTDLITLQVNGLPLVAVEDKYKLNDAIVFDADFLVLTYNFNDGEDLDTRTRIVEPNIGQVSQSEYLGWERLIAYPLENPLISFGGDNTGLGKESVLIDLKKLKALNSQSGKVVIDARAFWYGSVGVENVSLKVDLYKTGKMVKQGYTWINPTASEDFHFDTLGQKIEMNTQESNTSGERLSVVTYNFITNAISFNNNDTTTPSV